MQKAVKETIEEDSTNSSKQSDDLDPDYEPKDNVSVLLRDDECLDTSIVKLFQIFRIAAVQYNFKSRGNM